MKNAKPAKSKTTQKTRQKPEFEQVAKELGCPEDEATFDRVLKQIAAAGPVAKHQPKKRTKKA